MLAALLGSISFANEAYAKTGVEKQPSKAAVTTSLTRTGLTAKNSAPKDVIFIEFTLSCGTEGTLCCDSKESFSAVCGFLVELDAELC